MSELKVKLGLGTAYAEVTIESNPKQNKIGALLENYSNKSRVFHLITYQLIRFKLLDSLLHLYEDDEDYVGLS